MPPIQVHCPTMNLLAVVLFRATQAGVVAIRGRVESAVVTLCASATSGLASSSLSVKSMSRVLRLQ
jgi:hypothetical protein